MSERKWINEHPGIIIVITVVSALVCLATFIVPRLREGETEYTRSKKLGENRFATKDSNSAVIGKLIFERVPLRVRELSGNIHPLKKRGRIIKCGDSLDVMWTSGAVFFMKEKGLFEPVLLAQNAHFSDLEWDGQSVWVSVPKKGIWILDTSGAIVRNISTENGLPPSEGGLLMHPIEPGEMFAVGSFGPFGRGWCAIIEFKDGEASVEVFHEAKRVLTKTDDKKEVERDPSVVFKPYWIHEYRRENRRTLFIRRCEKKYSRHPLIYPLKVDLDTLDVSIASHKTMPSVPWRRGLEYNGKVYIPGRVWHCVDPKKHRREKLVTRGRLPDPYGSLGNYWVSAHYGLVGWAGNIELYQIRVTDEEHDIIKASPATKDEYYHTFAFEDANGSPFKFRGVDTVHLAIDRKGQPTLNYKYIPSRPGYFPVGTYKIWGTTTNGMGNKIKLCEFKPFKVTENSPVPLTFKISKSIPVESIMGGRPWLYSKARSREAKGGREILYCGQAVSALTGKPVEGAVVKAWGVKPKRIVNTDSNGRFELSLRSTNMPRELAVFAENCFNITIPTTDLGPAKDGRVDMQPILMFPAAMVKITPCIGPDVSSEHRATAAWLRIRPWVIPDDNESPVWTSTFSSMYGWVTEHGYISVPTIQMNQECVFRVPAGPKFKLMLIHKYEALCAPDVPQTIKLERGETLDLGRCAFEPALPVFLKVVNSAGEPVKGIAISKTFGDQYNFIQSVLQGRPEVHVTDENGKTAFYVKPNSEAAFDVYRSLSSWDVLKTVTFKIGGRDDEGKEFIVKL